MQNSFTKIQFFALSLTFFISCNSVKYVPENENLLKKNTIIVNDKNNNKSEITSFLRQKPNSTTLGVPISLFLYNFGNLEFEKTFDEWIANHPKKSQSFDKMFSKKQNYVIYKTNRSINNWFHKKFQAPVIFDLSKTLNSVTALQNYYISKGYFEAVIDYDINQIKEKQLAVNYNVTTNKQYYIDSISTQIESPVLDSIYQSKIENSKIKMGEPFVFSDFEDERNRLVTLFRNSGIYHYQDNIGFWTDSIKDDYNKSVVLKIPDRIINVGDSLYKVPYKTQKVTKVNVYTNTRKKHLSEKPTDSASYKGYDFYSYGKLKYKPKHLTRAIFITPNEYFKDAERNLTRNHIRTLQSFSPSVNIKYEENNDESLTANIYLNPLKKIALSFDLDATTSNIKPFGILGKFSILGRNMFKGSEMLELSFQGSFLNVSKDASNNSNFFNAFEVISIASLKFPRIIFPFNTNSIIPKYMAPRTTIDASVSFQKNIGLDRQNFTTGMSYSWKSTKKMGHRIDLFNLQYIKNQNIDNYFFIYDSEYQKLNLVSRSIFDTSLPQENDVILGFMDFILDPQNGYESTYPTEYDVTSDVNERRDILIEDVMVPVLSYSFVYNSKQNINDNDYFYFMARIVSAGNLTTLFAKNTNELGQKLLFGLPIAQYLKLEFDYKKYWELRQNNILVFRAFVGAAYPFGNSSNVPFSRSYSAGGSNEIRAWRTFELGPGGELNFSEYKVATFKLVANLEYRLKLTNKIFGALFIDAGNIWDITDSNLVSDEGKLTSFSSLKYTAVGSGFGLRYDFGFLVFRFDIGFKTYEPYLLSDSKWFVNYNFGHAVYNIGINYPF